jgi:hypothetical protein
MTATNYPEARMAGVPGSLPPAGELITLAREARRDGSDPSCALDRYAPDIDRLADAGTAAGWLGLSRASLYRERSRTVGDGIPAWPAADETAGRSGMWRFRTLVLYRAAMPGKGSAGRGRPRKPAGQAP